MTQWNEGDELDELADFDSRKRKTIENYLAASQSQGQAAGFLNGLMAGLPTEARQELYELAQQSSDWNEVIDTAARLRGSSAPAPRSAPAGGGGPDLTRKSPGFSGELTPQRYAAMSAEERKSLPPEAIDRMTARLQAERGGRR